MNAEDLEHHQRKCIYRKVFCPRTYSSPSHLPSHLKKCQINKILFKDVIEHLETSHKCRDYGEKNQIFRFFGTDNIGFENGAKNGFCWAVGKFATSCGAVFFTSAKILKNTGGEKRCYFWATFMGSPDEAENYSSSISIGNKIGKFCFTGKVHTIDEGADDIIASGLLLSIGINAAKRLLNEEKKLKVEFTIRNLKEEAKDEDIESGISDGE